MIKKNFEGGMEPLFMLSFQCSDKSVENKQIFVIILTSSRSNKKWVLVTKMPGLMW
jgi:hypothetical protein